MQEKPTVHGKAAMRGKSVSRAAWRVLPLCVVLLALVGHRASRREADRPPLLLLLGDRPVAAVDPGSLEFRPVPGDSLPDPSGERRLGAAGLHGSTWTGREASLVLVNEVGHELTRVAAADEVHALSADPAEAVLWSVEGRALVTRDLVSGAFLHSRPLPDLVVPVQLTAASRSGLVWLATGDAVLVVAPDGGSRRLDVPSPVAALRVDGHSAAWALAGGKLYHLAEDAVLEVPLPPALAERYWIDLEARSSVIWLTDGTVLARLEPNLGRSALREGFLGVRRLRLSSADRSPPAISWDIEVLGSSEPDLAKQGPYPGTTVEIRLSVDEVGSGVASPGVRLALNGAALTDACRVGVANTFTCRADAHYESGRLVLEARVVDRAGNRSNRLRTSWPDPRPGANRAATVEVSLPAVTDTYLGAGKANKNHGSKRWLRLRHGGFDRPALRFDLAATAGEIGILHGAYLELTITDNRDDWGSGGLVDLYRATSPWTESGATWNCADDADPGNPLPDCAPEWWGGDHAAEPTDSVLHTNGMSGPIEFDVTADVQAFLAGQPNHGWLLKHVTDGAGTVRYSSREHQAAPVPKLRVVFEPVTPDQIPPVIAFVWPTDGTQLADDRPILEIEVADDDSGVDSETLALRIDGSEVGSTCLRAQGLFCSLDEPLPAGVVTLTATVEDLAGNVSLPAQVTVTVGSPGPPPVDALLTSASAASGGVTTVTGLPGAAQPLTVLTATHLASGAEATSPVAADGSFEVVLAAEPGDVVELVVADSNGLESPPVSVLVPVPGACHAPPDPSLIVDPSPVLNYDLYEHSRFLWESEPAVQVGVAATALTADNLALARGRVRDGDGNPLPGVSVSVLGGSEYGCTASRFDGAYELAFAGGTVVLDFSREGYFAVQRRVTLPFGRQRTLDDVVMTAWPASATTVDSGQPQVQVARGAVEADANGTRQATLLVPEGVMATLELPDGSSQAAPPLTLRIREFTVGEDGPEAMPGVLPPASAYTYAFEAAADEAEALGAEIVFSQPVYKYLENYLDFPVGYAMPVGYYDKRAGVWVPSANGVVLAILSVDGAGRAQVDVDGSGQPADAATLAAFGFTDAERVELANLYAVGQELWRTPIPHLTPYDCNAPWIFSPADSVQPDPDVTAGGGEVCSDQQGGSILECQNQVFRDAIPIAGTPFALHYSSERVPGREFGRSVEIVLTPEEVPESLAGVILIVEVVGRKFRFTYPPVPNQTTTFVWDGLDIHGRPVIGRVSLEGRVGYVYPLDYGSASGDPGFGLPPGSSVSVRAALQQIVSWTEFSVTLESLNFGQTGGQLGLGMSGWSLTPQHVHTPQVRRSGELHRGDGSRQPSQQLAAEDVALLSGSQVPTYVWQGDAWVLQNASFSDVAGLAVDAEGNVYFSTASGYAIYQRRPDGTVYRMAGGPSATTWDDGVPAVTALLDRPQRLTVGPDGTLYVAEVDGDRIRRILPGEPLESRLIDTVAELDAPMDVSIGPDGGLYTAVYVPGSAHRVLRVDLETGQLATYAGGNGEACSLPDRGDDGPGLQACLILASSSILRMAWMADGSLLIPEGGGSVHASRIRRLWPDGTITTFMGDDTQGDPAYGQHYLNSHLHNPVFVAVDPARGHIAIVDRSIVLGDGRLSLIVDGDIIVLGAWPAASHIEWGLDGNLYWARDPLGGQGTSIRQRRQSDLEEADGVFRVPAPDGSEIYLFSAEGRHLETSDAYTGELVYGFHYNAAGQLYEIDDRYGEKVTIERDAAGYPSSITGPSGQVTQLTVDGVGNLTSVTNPEGETWRLAYGGGGLLETITSPRLYSKTLTYDSLGRLLTHTDARLATKTLTRSTGTSEYDVTFTTAEGRSTVYEVTRNSDGSQHRTRTEAGGIVTTTLLREDLSRTKTLPDGTSIDLRFVGDPRFGVRAPMPDLSVSTPVGNLTRTTSVARDFTLIDPQGSPGDPANLATFTEEVSVNGKVYTSNFDAESRTWLLTSPEGRTVATVLNAEGEVESIQRPSVESVTFIYDDQGRLEESRTGTGTAERITTFAYDPLEGWLDSVIDAETRTFGWQRDLVGRPEVTEYPDSRTLATAFDDNGNLESLRPPSQPAHAFTYDEVDLPSTYQAPGNPVESYAFNLDRQPRTLTLPSGQTMNWLYDPVTRRLEQIDTAADDHRFGYVPNTNQIQSIEHWPEGYQTGAPQTTTYTYDGFLPIGTAWSGPISGSVTQSYDHDFRIWDQFVNNQWRVTYGYDLDSLVISVATSTDSLSIVRDPATGRIDHTTLGSVTTSQGYNEFGELDSFAANAGASPLYSASYVRDHLGRIEQKTETVNGTTSIYDYGYDPAGRLDTVYKDSILVEDYGYDDNDNRLTYDGIFGPATGTYDDQDRLQTYGGVDYDFDADGYLTWKSAGGHTTTYDYDAMGSLRRVVLDSGITIEYLVDGQNRRVGKKIAGGLVQGFLYQDQLNPVAELDGAGNVIARFVYGTKAHVPDYMVTAAGTYRLITDHLGSVRFVVDTDPTAQTPIVQEMHYDSFGRVTFDSQPGFQPFGFAGGLYEWQTGLVRFGARDYDPRVGRWTAKDPIRFGGGDSNLYAYVAQDPVDLIDPSGQILPALVAAAAVAWAGLEIGLSLYDVYDFVRDLLTTCSDSGNILLSGAGLALGLAAPGGGYGSLLKAGKRVPNAGGRIRSFVTSGDGIFYRVFSGSNNTGAFLTKARPLSRSIATEGLALPPGNTASLVQRVIVPSGTRLQRSRALPAFGRRGGLEQFELLQPIPSQSFGPGVPLP